MKGLLTYNGNGYLFFTEPHSIYRPEVKPDDERRANYSMAARVCRVSGFKKN